MDELGYERDPVKASPVRLAWAYGTAPLAAARAAAVNRARLGRATQYLRRRAGSAFSRGRLQE